MPATITVDRGMELEKDLIAPADVANLEARPVALRRQPLLQSVGEATAKQSFFRNLIVEPIAGQIELFADLIRRHTKPVGQWSRRDPSCSPRPERECPRPA